MMAGLCTLCVFLAFGGQRVVGDIASLQVTPISGKLGGEANLTCDGITDYRNTELLFNDTTRVVERPGKFQNLPNGAFLIENIQHSDTGIYIYKKDSTHKETCIIKLQITEETMIVKPGSTASLSCKVEAAPVEMWSEVSWRRKYSSETATIVKNGSVSELAKQNFSGRISASWKKLVIRNADKGDSGKYTCIVEFKDNSPRGRYYINLIVSMSPTIKPTINKVKTSDESSTSTPPFPASSITKRATKGQSCATRLAFYLRLPVAILILLPLLL